MPAGRYAGRRGRGHRLDRALNARRRVPATLRAFHGATLALAFLLELCALAALVIANSILVRL
jgi:hypothetical protein